MIQITSDALDISSATDAVNHPSAGGIAIFVGTTRAETAPDGQQLIALDYEAYEDMAMKQLHALAAKVREQWPVLRLAIFHRIGRVDVGMPSVVIAVSTAHRKESFLACEWLIDHLKADVAIWKREVWDGGASTWVHPNL